MLKCLTLSNYSYFLYSLLVAFVFCQILSRGEITQQGFKKVAVTNSDGLSEGEVSFKVHVHPKMAPKMEFLAYCVLPSEIVLAASKTFKTEKCLENKVCQLSEHLYCWSTGTNKCG